MKILSILPVHFKTADPIIAALKRVDKSILAPLSSHVCHSFAVAHRLLQKRPFAYDFIISAYTPDEFLPARDRIPGSRGCYGSSTSHIVRLLEDNPLARLILWTGAAAEDIWLPPGLVGRISTILHGGSAPHIGYYNWDREGRAQLRDTMAEALSEFCLSLNNRGQFVMEAICRRGLVEMVFRSPTRPRSVRPCLAKSISCWVPDLKEFLQLVNQESVTAREVESFLERNPRFPFGNILTPRRWMIGLRKDGPDRSEQVEDMWLEPAWVPQCWDISDLEAPAISRPQVPGSERQWSRQLLAEALAQLRAKRKAINRRQFRHRLADAGLTGYSPHLALILGTNEALELPRTPPEQIGIQKAMTYSKLNQLVRKETGWLASPVTLDYGRNERYVRYHDSPIRSTSNVPPAGPRWVKLARRLTVLDRYGICARPAALIVRAVQRCGPHNMARVTCDGISVSGDDIMGLLTLEANQGKQLLVEVQGPLAAKLLEELTQLFNKGFYFDEDMLPVPDAHHEYVQTIATDCPTSDGEDKEAT